MINNQLVWKVMGYDMEEANNFLKDSHHLTPEGFMEWREDKIWKIFNFHYENNNLFRNKCNEKKSIWNDIPIMTKKDFQVGLDNILSTGYNTSNSYVANTSGSSGHPFWFAKDKFCHALAWSYIDRAYKELSHGELLIEARFFGHIKSDKKTYIKEKLKDYFLNRTRFNIFDQSTEYFDQVINTFKRKSFTYIYGYTNALLAFTDYLVKCNDRPLKKICPSLKFVLLTAEICTSEQRNQMSDIFGVPVYKEYGSSETSIIAIEDSEYQWNIASDRLHVEIVDNDGNPVKYGQKGRVLITDFYNYAMPVIRYDIGDYGSLEQTDKNPFIKLKSLDGRLSDVISLSDGRRLPGLTFYYISRSIIESGTKIKRFIIRQKQIDEFVFDYVSDEELSETMKKNIKFESKKYLKCNVDYIFNRVKLIPDRPSGKIQHFFSEVK